MLAQSSLIWPGLPPPWPPMPLIAPPILDDRDTYITSIAGGTVGIPGPAGPPGPPGPPGVLPEIRVVEVTTSEYSPSRDEQLLAVNSGVDTTITLPIGTIGTSFIIKDVSGIAGLFPITIQGTLQEIDDGTATISSNYGSLSVIFTGTKWSII